MKFKNILKKSPILVLAFMLSSCDKMLDLEPKSQLTKEQALEGIKDFENLLSPIYRKVKGTNFYYNLLPDMMSDNLRDNASLGNWKIFINWDYTANTAKVASLFTSQYNIILQSNQILSSIDDHIKLDEKGEQDKKDIMVLNRVKGQAVGIRAMAYFDLLRYFAESYDRDSPKLGLPIVEPDGVNIIESAPRNSVKETYDFIYKDLEEAEKLLGGELDHPINTRTNKRRFDVRALYALRARVSLYAKKYEDAAKYATKLIDIAETAESDIKLASPTELLKVYNDDTNCEFEIIFSMAYNAGSPGNVPNDGSTAYGLSDSWTSLNLTDDVRTIVNTNPDVKTLGKYTGRGEKTDGVVDAKVFRTSEVYLIRAEAFAYLTNESGAKADLNKLRAQRIIQNFDPAAVDALSGDGLKAAIQQERRLELVAEGHRFFDVRRIGKGFEKKNDDCAGNHYNCVLEPGSHRFVFPIPAREIEANDGITQGDQNQGY